MKKIGSAFVAACIACQGLAVFVERSCPKDTFIPSMKFGLDFRDSGVAKVEPDALPIPPRSPEWAQAYKGWSTLPPEQATSPAGTSPSEESP